MRLHRLEIEAFGPFGGHEVVDFDALSDAGLFLLSGPTGAGKTSVLDAVCFALFGEVPGARGDAARLASDHRDPGATPRVTLEATIGGRRILVTRVPAHERPPKKGDGAAVKDTGSAVLAFGDPTADDGWRAVAAKIPEVRRELDPLLGMTAEQFLQVVMLPQGAFATFLRADAKARREVLERLFDAGRFSKIELWLQDRAREARQAVEQHQIAADNALAEAGGAWIAGAGTDGVGGPPSLRDGATVADVDAWLAAEHGRLTAEHDQAIAARDAAQAALADVDRERDAARTLAGLQEQRREAEARLATVAEEADAHAARVAELRAHRQAAPLTGYLSVARKARAEAPSAAEKIEKARKWVATLDDPQLDDDAVSWTTGARARSDAAASLQELVEQEATVAERHHELQRRRSAATAAAERASQGQAQLDQLAAAEAALERRRAASDAATAEAARLHEQVAAAKQRAAAGRERDRLKGDDQRAADKVRRTVDAHQSAVDHAQRVRQARLEGYAAELAAALHAEDACPVCGATDHPSPAAPSAGHVTAAEEQAAVAAAQAAQLVREAAEQHRSAIQAALAAARGISGDEPTASLDATAASLGNDLERAKTAAADAQSVSSERTLLQRQREELQRNINDAHVASAELRTQAEALETELQRLAERIERERNGHSSVAARVKTLSHEARHLERAVGAFNADGDAREALDEAEKELASAMAEHGVDDEAAAVAAVRSQKDLDTLEAEIQRVTDARTAAEAVLARPDIVAVPLEPAVDIAAVEAHRVVTAQTAEDAATRAASAARCAEAEQSRRPALRAQLDALAPLRDAADRAYELAELARGGKGNQRKIQLSSWVLAARLEQVAAAATVHLLKVSGGRYRLVLHEEPASGRGKGNAGLGLRVLDGWTGEERDTTTLSGGESFFASLSLALGLAETVTAEAGGMDLGTLFIDEGFGSLDEQTLDEVLGALDDLRDGGRAVGIVSHVPELKQRIPVQLTVEKARDGSHLRQNVAVA